MVCADGLTERKEHIEDGGPHTEKQPGHAPVFQHVSNRWRHRRILCAVAINKRNTNKSTRGRNTIENTKFVCIKTGDGKMTIQEHQRRFELVLRAFLPVSNTAQNTPNSGFKHFVPQRWVQVRNDPYWFQAACCSHKMHTSTNLHIYAQNDSEPSRDRASKPIIPGYYIAYKAQSIEQLCRNHRWRIQNIC